MSISAFDYYKHLKSHLNMNYYAVYPNLDNELVLKEKIFVGEKKKELKVKFSFSGEVFAIKLDKEYEKGKQHPLFHFLDNESKAWSKRCDFIVFHLNRNVKLYLIEYKYETLPIDSIIDQLNSSVAWCHSLQSTLKHYTNKTKRLNLTKFVFSQRSDPSDYLDTQNKYLRKDPSIRHYHYRDVNGINLENLENSSIEQIN